MVCRGVCIFIAAQAGFCTVPAMAGEPVAPAHITIGRALDLVGRPIDLARVERDTAVSSNVLSNPASLPSGMPVAATALTSGFGMRFHPILGEPRAHLGVDLAAPAGAPVVATSDGVVGWAGPAGGYGMLVEIEGAEGTETRYGHLSRLSVANGQRVRKGQVIGLVGSTGLSTGMHLHYEIRVDGRAVNPVKFLRAK